MNDAGGRFQGRKGTSTSPSQVESAGPRAGPADSGQECRRWTRQRARSDALPRPRDSDPPPPAPRPRRPSPSTDAQEWVNRRASAQATRAANARQVSGRRRFVDPTTCEREYTVAEMEFMQAMHDYKQSSGRMFPTWSEVLEVLKALGYAEAWPTTSARPGRRPASNRPGTDRDRTAPASRRRTRLTPAAETAYREPNPFVGKRFRSQARPPRS